MQPEQRINHVVVSWPILGMFLIATLIFSLLAAIAFAPGPARADADAQPLAVTVRPPSVGTLGL